MSVNFELIQKLCDHLVWLREQKRGYKFNMASWLHYRKHRNTYAMTLNELREKLHEDELAKPISATECGTVACLAGHVALLTNVPGSAYIETHAATQLGLDSAQAFHMFGGVWAGKEYELSKITINEAIRYLDLVLKRRNVMVRIYEKELT